MGKILVAGSLNMDTVISVKDMPKTGETIFGKGYALYPGGKGANQAYALGRLGADVCMIGCVGNDSHGKKLIHNLQLAGVDVKGIQLREDTASGTAFIMVNEEGDNSIIVIAGANYKLDKACIDENIEIVEECQAVIMQLEIPMETVIYLAKTAKEKGKTVILDPAPAPGELPVELFQYVDIVKPNETELETITGMKTETEEEIVTAARQLIRQGVRQVVVTLGERGTILVTGDGYQVFEARKVKAVDTTAAGDSFMAAFVMKLMEGESSEEAIKFGSIVSSIAVTRKGAQNSIPGYEEAQELFQSIYNATKQN